MTREVISPTDSFVDSNDNDSRESDSARRDSVRRDSIMSDTQSDNSDNDHSNHSHHSYSNHSHHSYSNHGNYSELEKTIADLETAASSLDISEVCRQMDFLITHSSSCPPETLCLYSIDPCLKQILSKHMSIQIIDRIGDLLPLIRDPRNIYDELSQLLLTPSLTLPALMLIFQLKQNMDFEFDPFFIHLESVLIPENVLSEGFLLFLLRCLNDRSIGIDTVFSFLKKLSSLSVEVPSECCMRMAYCILVIMRMHPATFKRHADLKELHILAHSLKSIKAIVRRIFIEASNPRKRPKMVFLQNFTFPDLVN